MDPKEVAKAYATIAAVQPPTGPTHIATLGELALLRSVDPRQSELLEKLCLANRTEAWSIVRDRVDHQRAVRNELFTWIGHLDQSYRTQMEDFVFPDPYSLLFWIWTFQLFTSLVSPLGSGSWSKYFYRGEVRDYGSTRFRPSIARSTISGAWRRRDVAGRIRRALVDNFKQRMPHNPQLDDMVATHLVETMSDAQALAIGQHYGCPTPLLDVTTHPEVALFFATQSATEDIALLGFCDVGTYDMKEAARALSLVSAPAPFTRIHLQNGYFLCMASDDSNSAGWFQILRFKHCREVEPLLPTWLSDAGFKAVAAPATREIMEDPLDLQPALRTLPDSPMLRANIDASLLKQVNTTIWLKTGLSDIAGAAGRLGITFEGLRFAEINQLLLYSLFRHSPEHNYIYTTALIVAEATDGLVNSLKHLLYATINLYRALLIVAYTDAIGTEAATRWIMQLDGLAIVRLTAPIIGDPSGVLPFPLSSWYD